MILMPSRLTFKTEYYFPGRLTWAIATSLSAVAFLAAGVYWMSVLTLIIGVVSITTHYGANIDFQKKTYREYIWLLGLKLGKTLSYRQIEYLFVKDLNIKQKFNSRVSSTTINYTEFRGFVKFSETEKMHILTNRDYDSLVKDLKPLAQQLNVGLIDYTFGHRSELIAP